MLHGRSHLLMSKVLFFLHGKIYAGQKGYIAKLHQVRHIILAK